MYTLKEVKRRAKRENDEKNRRLHFFASRFSIYFSWIFINLGISANGVTLIFFLTGLIGSLLFLSTNLFFIIMAYVFWRMHILFDICDGEVARFTQKFSINGAYWDYMIHSILYPLTFATISVSIFQRFNDINLLYLGLFGSIIVSQTQAVKNNYYRAMLFNNHILDKDKGANKQSNKDFLLFNVATLLLNFEGFLFLYLILSYFTNNELFYFYFLLFYIFAFFLQVVVKFTFFSKRGFYTRKN